LVGVKYVGDFKYGKIDGQGTFNHTDGKVEKGIWRNGQLKSRTDGEG